MIPARSSEVVRAVDADRGHALGQDRQRVVDQILLVGADVLHAQVRQVVEGNAPRPIAADTSGVPASNLYGTSLNVEWRSVTSRIISPPPMNGGISSRISRARPQRATAWRPERLVAAEDEEVAVQVLDVDRLVRRRLGRVDEHERAGLVRLADHLLDRVDRADAVRHGRERDELGIRAQQDLERVLEQAAVIVEGHELEVGVLLLGQQLPRDEVRVVLHLRGDDRVGAA